MSKEYIETQNAILRQEYPGDQAYTAGWTKGFDVYLNAQQHGHCKDVKDVPCLVSEYGFGGRGARNASDWQQNRISAANGEAHSTTLETKAMGGAKWAMFDYNAGCRLEMSEEGVGDLFRLPKTTFHLYRSQRDPSEKSEFLECGPMVYIASSWSEGMPLEIPVYSNADHVSLYLNDKLVGEQEPQRTGPCKNLPHPPFLFKLPRFEPGTLLAKAFIGGKEVASHRVTTPGIIQSMELKCDLSGKPFAQSGKDSVICHAFLKAESGQTHPMMSAPVAFGVVGDGDLIGRNPMMSRAGISSILLNSDKAKPDTTLYSLALLEGDEGTKILSAGARPDGKPAAPGEIRYTLDGTCPTAKSPVYEKPLAKGGDVWAAVFVGGKIAVEMRSQPTVTGTASETEKGHLLQDVVDGRTDTAWVGIRGNEVPHQLEIDYRREQKQPNVQLIFGGIGYTYSLETSMDAIAWTTICDVLESKERVAEHRLSAPFRFLRIKMQPMKKGWPSIHEISLLDEAGFGRALGNHVDPISRPKANPEAKLDAELLKHDYQKTMIPKKSTLSLMLDGIQDVSAIEISTDGKSWETLARRGDSGMDASPAARDFQFLRVKLKEGSKSLPAIKRVSPTEAN